MIKASPEDITRYVTDGGGNVLAEYDYQGLLQRKYVYANGQKMVRLDRNYNVPANPPYNLTMESTADIDQSYPGHTGAVISESTDRIEGTKSVKTTTNYVQGASSSHFRLNTINEYTAVDWPYVHVWVKPLANAKWVYFKVIDNDAGSRQFDWIQGDIDGDGYFDVGEDLVAGRWNELWLDVRNVIHVTDNHSDPGPGRKVSEFHIFTNVESGSDVVFLWDHVFVTDEAYTPSYLHNDYLGSVRRITGKNGNLTWSRDYYPFGEDRSASGTDNDYKFTGKEWDDESELFNYWHRYYDPVIGRFVQVDPKWGAYPSLTPYQYAANNPLKYVDPDGKKITNPQKFVLGNKYVVAYLIKFDAEVARLAGIKSSEFEIRITGGDRYWKGGKKEGKSYSATTGEEVPNVKWYSAHLKRWGARDVDFRKPNHPKVTDAILKKAAGNIAKVRYKDDYTDGHGHIGLPRNQAVIGKTYNEGNTPFVEKTNKQKPKGPIRVTSKRKRTFYDSLWRTID